LQACLKQSICLFSIDTKMLILLSRKHCSHLCDCIFKSSIIWL
jgi:hypothetical protein